MAELRPGVFLRLFTEIAAEGQARSRAVVGELARVVEKQAKTNASSGSHGRGTPTPARPGSGPAVISGTLRRSITHTEPVLNGRGWECKVGTAPGRTPNYGNTPANKYGYFLETGLVNGARYPFLKPAAHFGMSVAAPALYRKYFAAGWKSRI
jgi:hypothetical protein